MSDEDIIRKIQIAGHLSTEEVRAFLRVYKSSMADLEQLFSVDDEIKKLIGD